MRLESRSRRGRLRRRSCDGLEGVSTRLLGLSFDWVIKVIGFILLINIIKLHYKN
jgi:hypothetical protein